MRTEPLERKLAAILYADVAGYSRLTGEDEEGTHRALRAYLDVITVGIESHRGRVVHYAGDAVLADFATVSDSLSCAVDVQRHLKDCNQDLPDDRKVQFRIGINLGEVIVDQDEIYGDGVNVAARLESLAEPGGICISESVRTAIGKKLPLSYGFMGEQEVKNIAEPVRAYRVQQGLDEVTERPSPEAGAIPLAGKPSIAVLPFNNISGDPEQDYFSDGLTEDIITLLAAWRSFPVIARNSTFAYKNQSPDVRQVANDLGARYVLEGSVRKAGNRVRISAQLIDGLTGNHLWADRYDRELEDVFAVQDEITTNIVAAVEPEMSKAEILAVTRKRPGNLNSWELYLRGLANMPSYGRYRTETKQLFEKSIEADPTFADAYTALALCYSADVYAQYADYVDGAATMFDLAKKATAIDSRNFRIYLVLCMAHIWKGDLKHAVEAGRKAVELNPSSPEAYEVLALALTHSGEPEEAEGYGQMCLKLSPLDPKLHNYYFQLVQATLGQRRFEEAYVHLEKCLSARPHDVSYLGFKTILLGHMGRKEEARVCLDEYLSKRGIKTADDYRKIFVLNSVQTELNLDGLRKAGWEV
ncbi:MAG: adenylate/guanylate cyclase domain-containing protein [Proteobacteria bacterium]|nr:adenylate/guanylate cyclase domain-containing protein [Pseudomonadota bacterium]